MTSVLRYLTHPQVQINPLVPVPQWGLSDLGHSRTHAIKNAAALKATHLIISSGEAKAIETASIIAEHLHLKVTIREATHENDRSATGYLPPPEFERMANAFFAEPEKSIRGWERAIDAQARIVAEAQHAIAQNTESDILMVGHGGVGTLLYCHFAKLPISRSCDQAPGGGNFFTVSLSTRHIIHSWRVMEEI